MKEVMQKVQRFGGAMFTPVLLFSFAGIMVGLSTLFMNQSIFGTLATEGETWYKIWYMIQEGAWMVFRQMPLLFAIGLPIGLAKKQNARCVLEAFTIYVTFNYFLSAILKFWGTNFGVDFAAEVGGTSGLAYVCGIKTLDTGMLGALIISGVVVWIHNKYFDTELPEWLGIFSGSSFVVMIGFFVMIPMAFLFAIGWPKVQEGMLFLQDFFKSSGTIGVGLYAFCEKILLPTGLHHFIYAPFALDSAVVPGGIEAYWNLHLSEFAQSTQSLRELFPAGAFHLYGTPKVFAPMGITLAFYMTAKKEKKKQVLALMIPAALTAMITGITEPIEFTFLFVAPVLFLVHAILCACLNMAMYIAGVRGAFANGLIAWIAQDWIPCWNNHWMTYVIQIVVGLAFTAIWFLVFRFLIKKFNFKTPGREEDDVETKLYTKKDYKEKQAEKEKSSYAAQILVYLGGKENIIDVTNCATRLRINVKDSSKVRPEVDFKRIGAHGLSVNGNSVQVIVGLKVPKVREEFEECLAQADDMHIKDAEETVTTQKLEKNHTVEQDEGIQSEKYVIYAPQNGKTILLEDVPDETFAQKMLGEGVAILPNGGEVYAPAAGKVVLVAETKHAIAIETEDGAEILIHIGLDTVELGGKGFDVKVAQGDQVEVGTLLCCVSKELWKNSEKPLYTPIIISNSEKYSHVEVAEGQTIAGKTVILRYGK